MIDDLSTGREVRRTSSEWPCGSGGTAASRLMLWDATTDAAYPFVDATSSALMPEASAAEALAFDRDFTAEGFIELRPA